MNWLVCEGSCHACLFVLAAEADVAGVLPHRQRCGELFICSVVPPARAFLCSRMLVCTQHRTARHGRSQQGPSGGSCACGPTALRGSLVGPPETGRPGVHFHLYNL